MIKTVVFDFDGVFVSDSDAVFKNEAWSRVFAPYEGRHEPFLKEGKSLYGSGKPGGRLEILRYVYEKLGEPADAIETLVARATQAFDEYVQTRILEAGLVGGATETLSELSRCGISIYLNSGTPLAALELSARNLKIHSFFEGIFGSTKSKTDNLRYIVEQKEKIDPSSVLMVGDSEADREAANEVGCRFVGVSNQWNRWKEKERPFPVVESLKEVQNFL